jgi:hypothetical protein
VCPAGRAIADMPTAANKAHALAECSGKGTCNRLTGQCRCAPPYEGSACQRSTSVDSTVFYLLLLCLCFTFCRLRPFVTPNDLLVCFYVYKLLPTFTFRNWTFVFVFVFASVFVHVQWAAPTSALVTAPA